MSESYILGIDPGLSGALCFMGKEESFVTDMPVFEVMRNKKKKREINLQAVVGLISQHNISHCYFEKVGAMPGQGVTSMFAMGRGVGNLEGILAAFSVPVTYVTPQKWKKSLGVTGNKDESRKRASELMPDMAEYWPLKKHDGRAESALIAYYGFNDT